MDRKRVGFIAALISGVFAITLAACGGGGGGTTPPAPNIVVTDSVVSNSDLLVPFGTVILNSTSDQTVTVTNTGTADLIIGTVASANQLGVPFSITKDTCSGQTIAPAGSCELTVQFKPIAETSYPDSFDIPSNDPDTPTVTVYVDGTGTATPVPHITVTDSVGLGNDHTILFGNVTIGSTSDQTVTVTNTGTADLTIGVPAPFATPFGIAEQNCWGQTIAPNGTCTVTIRFSPIAETTYTGSYDITSNDPDTPTVTVSLNGTGATPPPSNTPALPISLPATGQTTCYDAAGAVVSCTGTGQDGERLKGVVWPIPRFVAGTGAELDCITDKLTGLMWAKNANMPAASMTWQQALDYIAAMNSSAGLCGYHDWKLRSFAHYGQSSISTWLNNASQGFSNVGLFYWTSTTYMFNSLTSYAWGMSMSDAYLSMQPKGGGYSVWPVRGEDNTSPAPLYRTGQTTCYDQAGAATSCAGTGQDGEWLKGAAWPTARFTTNSDTTVTDRLSGLTWASIANTPTVTGTPSCTGGAQNWQSAFNYIACLNVNNYLGHNDWRLPNVNELQSLSNDDSGNSAGTWLNTQGFSNFQPNYWSSDTHLVYPSYGWVVNVVSGMAAAGKTSSYYVWPVRGGQ